MGRLIINFKGMSEAEALRYVQVVVYEGRISGDGFCYVTQFQDGVTVYADRTRSGSDTFKVWMTEEGI